MPEDLELSHPQPLGRLERVDLRTAWPSEAQDFTPWLARDENISVLAETLGMELEVEAQEKDVGPFRADILCRDTDSPEQESWVLIENQLAQTNHTHLGQLLTYAAGLHAVTIVWIAQPFRDEHRATLDWLNEITDERFRFFGLEVELWKIGDSLAAPKFNVVSKPNEWTQEAGEGARQVGSGSLSAIKQQQRRFWERFSSFIEQRSSSVRLAKPKEQHWINSGLGKSGFHLSAGLNSIKKQIYVELRLSQDDAKPHFHLLKQQQPSIEGSLDINLDWRELPSKKASRILTILTNTDPTDENDWPRQQDWLADTLVRFDEVFRPIVHELDATDWQPDDEPGEDDTDEMGREP